MAALLRLGVDSPSAHFLDLPDGELDRTDRIVSARAIKLIESLIAGSDSLEVYAPHRKDGHRDHETAFAWTLEAVRRTGRPVSLFEYPIWLWWSRPIFLTSPISTFRRTMILHLEDVLAQKRAALACHRSQLPLFPVGFLRALASPVEIYFDA